MSKTESIAARINSSTYTIEGGTVYGRTARVYLRSGSAIVVSNAHAMDLQSGSLLEVTLAVGKPQRKALINVEAIDFVEISVDQAP